MIISIGGESNVREGKMRKAMFQLKDKIKIQMLDQSKTTGVPMFGTVYEFQCLEG